MTLEGKAALVTGAAKRVGRTIAAALAGRGACLALHYHRSRAQADELARDLRRRFGTRCVLLRADLSRAREASRLADAAAGALGRLDVLVNNASLYERREFARVTERDWDAHLDANLKGPFFLAQAAARHMRKAGAGRIVNIADWAAHRPYPGYIPYCVSKAGLLCLNKALAKALGPEILVNAVLPGPVLLPEGMSRAERQAVERATIVKRLGSPQDVARAVLFLLEDGDFMTGAELAVDGGRLIA